MKPTASLFKVALLSTCLLGTSAALAQQPPAQSFSDLNMPSAEVTPHPEYIKALARTAYLWGWPMVNMQNRHDQITQAPEPGRLGGVLPVAPRGQIGMLADYIEPSQRFIACPNQDVVYGLGFFDLDEEPVVVQVPDFGDRFWVYAAYDQRTDQFGELGKPYDTKPGFYLMVGPNWDGETPEGITGVIQSSTSLANIVPRVFMNDTDEDRAAIQDLIDQVVVYPLADFDGEMKTIDWSEAPAIPNPSDSGGGGETQWVVPENYFDQLGGVLDAVAPLPGEEAMYAQFRWLLDLAERDPDIKQVLVDEAIATDEEVIKPFLRWEHNGRPAGNGWNRSTNNAEWGVDYYDRTGTARSNMFDNRPNETQYFYTDYDASGEQLVGSNSYTVTFPADALPPVNGFWSMTMYDEAHFFADNDLGRYSLGTKNTDLQMNDDGSLTIHVGATKPEDAPESNWLPAPEENFSLYIRAYWGKDAILDGSWQPPAIEVAE
ncbi:DUF1254 domain-containing protein [Halomonas huangheensis]|uniref:DUF1254 domain-containing protein n=1 Tax=Halomonas huangheensis TaxID=1178482 RepID=W1N502_9GAMM|nr:DUF1254 domain-containing protein [Halomonas huangheensis]ALM52030.1 hypothetical protein AR456_06860 [Halomonas huangheensis]ERL50584.1 hypothetical protein BJB45_05500 [Halomonas huangheensis]